jgi:hypothetical protein
MSIAITNRRAPMLKKILLATSAAAATLGFSSGAFADPPRWAPAHGWRAHHQPARVYYYAPRPVYVVPAPRVVYAAPPPPVVYYPAPAYRPAPVYATPGVSIRLHLPL